MDLFKNAQPVMKTKHTYMLNFLRNSCFRRLLSMYVCSKSLCLSWKTLNQGSQKLSSTVFRLIMYVCLKKVQNPSACHAFCNSDSTQTSEPQRFFNFQKDTVRDTILILVYIHTYPVFARRINIVKPKTYIHTQQRENALRHRRLLKPKTQISCLDQKVCPNLGFCKCFEAFWRACSKLGFLSFRELV